MKGNLTKGKISLGSHRDATNFYNLDDFILEKIEERFKVKISARGNRIQIVGEKENVEEGQKYIKSLLNRIRRGESINILTDLSFPPRDFTLPTKESDVLLFTTRGKEIRPKTPNQLSYVKAMFEYDMVFGIGPAGTGKTYLAVAMAVLYLKTQKVSRIILTRPAVEAGEKLGFLPGDIQAKVDPYFRPIYDALFDMIEFDKFQNYLERGIIEIAPLAFMRGRTLNDAFIILDEAQNTTPEQMKMFLTRLGFSSRAVITGDITQIDLPNGTHSGLIGAKDILSNISEIKIIYFTEKDIVRHELVQKIIKAYEDYEMLKSKHRGNKLENG